MVDEQFWQGRRVFVTGHTGFKGSWLCLWLNSLGARVTGFALAPPTDPDLFELSRADEVIDSTLSDVRNGDWRRTGTIGHVGTSSSYPSHHMTMGEGGAVYADDTTLKRIVEFLCDWGRDCWCPSGHDNTCAERFNRQFGELHYGYMVEEISRFVGEL
jgi:hypothetical protein